MGSHGYGVSRFAHATSPACFITVINGTRWVIRKDKQPRFLFLGGGVGRHGDTKINARFPMST